MNRKNSVMIIATYNEMQKMYQSKLNELGVEFQVGCTIRSTYGSNEQEILDTLYGIIHEGIHVVITRGVMAKLIKKYFDVQVIDVKVSEYNVLEILKRYMNYNGVIGVVECDTYVRKVKKVGELLGMNIRDYVVHSIDDFNPQIENAIQDGVEVILGGSWTLHNPECIENKDVIIEIIKVTDEEIDESVINALKIYENLVNEKSKNEMLNSILNYSMEGIISVDNYGNVTTYNHEAQKVFGQKYKDVIGKKIFDVFPELELKKTINNGKITLGDVCKLNNVEIVLNKVPMVVGDEVEGALVTFVKIDDIQKFEKTARMRLSEKGLIAKMRFEDIKGKSIVTRNNVQTAKAYAKINSTVLLSGETGTGKEVFAQAIHNGSLRKEGPFVAVNCAALPSNLLESELFGYADGAFTGASKGGKRGLFELAHGGTLLLDEIGEIDGMLQVRLLRVLQEREIMRIGDDRIIPVDVRIISATNKNLKTEIRKGNFRADLFYRLNILNINLQPLRKKKEDLEELVDIILKSVNQKLRYKVTGIDNELYQAFLHYDWPGNIRELRNVIEKIVVITQTGVAKYCNVENAIEDLDQETSIEEDENELSDIFNMTLSEIEQMVILRVLKEENYNKKQTAERLGIGRSTLFRKINS